MAQQCTTLAEGCGNDRQQRAWVLDEAMDFLAEHRALLEEIARDVAESAALTGRSTLSTAVAGAMLHVPRHRFVPVLQRFSAYENRPLSIGCGQTISQPFIVAIMTELLDLQPEDRVLEVGTGCGYQTAVLAEIARQVFTIEVVPQLASAARERLTQRGYHNIQLRTGDGYDGWPQAAPFDAILVTAAPDDFPAALDEQLRPGGRLVIPVGPRNQPQMLWRCEKTADGAMHRQQTLPVAFVPMVPHD
jgi:protein-L-isoaspartate(D-aspartate) O-methyltransferase